METTPAARRLKKCRAATQRQNAAVLHHNSHNWNPLIQKLNLKWTYLSSHLCATPTHNEFPQHEWMNNRFTRIRGSAALKHDVYGECVQNIHCVPKKAPPPKQSTVTLIILNRNQWKLHRTDWHQFEHCVLNCKWVQFQGRVSATHQKCIFPKRIHLSMQWTVSEAITVTNGVQNVRRQRSHTLTVEYATDNHAVLIKWKVRQCWHQSEQYSRQ